MKHSIIILHVALIFLVTSHVTTWAQPATQKALTTNKLEQYGITWTFSDAIEFGEFANGDYYVIDPGDGVKITNINPGDTTDPISGRAMNGSMLNPSTSEQGYDGAGSYSASKNVGIGISQTTPLILKGDISLVSTISNLTPGGKNHISYVKTAAVLTCLSSAPPPGSFRPGISGTNKTLYNKGKLNLPLLKKLPIPSGLNVTVATLETYAKYFQMVWLDHNGSWTSRYLHPSDGLPDNYYYAPNFSDAALLLHLNFTDKEKNTLLINYVQLGVDLFSYINSDARGWPPDGGHSNGRKWPILFSGLMLSDSSMIALMQKTGDYLYSGGHGAGNPPLDYIHFGEDGQTFYVSPFDVDITNGPTWSPDKRTAPNFSYTPAMTGMPEWGIRHSTQPNRSDSSWRADYRTIGSAVPSWIGFTLAARIMGAKKLWNNDALFDYVDRYMAITGGKPDPFGYIVQGEQKGGRPNRLAAVVWDTYRRNY
jgi:hypothetical protein